MENETDYGADNNTNSAETAKSSQKAVKHRSPKQIEAAENLVRVQKERRDAGLPIGRKKKQTAGQTSIPHETNFNNRYDTELLWEFDQARRDDAKKERLEKALSQHFTSFEDKMNSKIINNIKDMFEGPLNKYFSIVEEDEKESDEEAPPPKKRQREEESEDRGRSSYSSFFPVHRQEKSTSSRQESQRKDPKSFWN
jgi:hypothetical protein